MPITFKMLDSRYDEEVLGLIPFFLSEQDERPAAEQINDRYAHGGGWRPMSDWLMGPVGEIRWGTEESLMPLAVATLREETIRFYRHAWVSITQPDGSFEVSRID